MCRAPGLSVILGKSQSHFECCLFPLSNQGSHSMIYIQSLCKHMPSHKDKHGFMASGTQGVRIKSRKKNSNKN